MSSINTDELLTPAQAARLMNVSREWVRRLMNRGDLPKVEIAGQPFVKHRDVMSYKPGPKTGRPAKSEEQKAGKRAKKR